MISSLVGRIEREIRNIKDYQVIVEGKKDREAMEKLGFKNIVEISGKNFSLILNEIEEKNKVVILTDFDNEGEEMAKELSKFLISHGFKVDCIERKILRDLLCIKKIEELKFILKFMEDDYNGKACSIHDKIFNRSRVLLRRNSGKT
ncbi:MAG: toprim domain-containing protein [Candidatus Aenigmatarchaeota archaeon]